MNTAELTPEALTAIERARKLLETRGRTEEETALYIAKAQEILERHGLDMAAAKKAGAKDDGKRDDTKTGVALYQWQRDVWAAVAKLNGCVHFAQRGLAKGEKYQHRIVGRPENVMATQLFASYICDAINRYAQEEARRQAVNVFCRDMIAFREGAAERLVERLQEMRRQREADAKARKAEDDAQRKHPSYAGAGQELILITDVMEDENWLNEDYLAGLEPGTTKARTLAARARQAVIDRKWELFWARDRETFEAEFGDEVVTLYDRWVAAAEEREAAAKKQLAVEQEKARKRLQREETMRANGTYREPQVKYSAGPRYRQETPQEARQRMAGFAKGRAAGDKIGLDTQVGQDKRNKLS